MFIIRILTEGILLAFQALWSNKLRSFLSLLGVSIGIFCVISVMSMVDGLEDNVRTSFNKLGDDVIYVQRFSWSDSNANWWKYIKRPHMNYDEYERLYDRSQSAELVALEVRRRGEDLKYKDRNVANVEIIGGTPDLGAIKNLDFENGRYFTESESKFGSNKIIIGHSLSAELFREYEDPIGKEIKLMGRRLKVIGVLKEEGTSLLGAGNDGSAFVPINFLRTFLDINHYRFNPTLILKAKEIVSVDELIDETRSMLRAERRMDLREEDNFSFNQMSIITNRLDEVFGMMWLAGFTIGLFSIIVGVFGIANIMFVTVKERTKIIGIKKSLGAKRYHILIEFLAESIVLTIIGGLFGLLLVFALITIGNAYFFGDLAIALSLKNISIGLFISVVTGLSAGIVPAWTASNLDPVVAIRTG